MENIETIQESALKASIETITKETVSELAIKELRDTYAPQIITDGASLKFMVEGAKTIKKHMSTIESRRKDMTAPALKFQKDLKKHTDGLRSELGEIREGMEAKIKEFEDKELAEKKKLFNERCDKLIESGFDLVGGFYVCGMLRLDPEDINKWDDDDLEFYTKKGIEEKTRREAEQKRLDDERASIQKERDELAAQKAALEKQYGHLIEAEVEPEPESKSVKVKIPAIERVITEKTKTVTDSGDMTTPIETVKNALNEIEAMEKGFDVFRDEFLKLMASPEKFNRKILIGWAENLKFDDVCLDEEN